MDTITQLSDMHVLMFDELPGIDTYTLNQHLQQAQREFCNVSEAFREALAAIDLVADQTDYTLTPSFDCRIKRVTEVWIRSESDVDSDLEGTQQVEAAYRFIKPNTLVLADDIAPSAAVTDGLVVEVVLVPEITQAGTNVLTREFLNDYAEGIMARAFYTLKKMPRQRWTDLKIAAVHLKDYYSAITNAKADISMMNKTQPDGFEA